MPKIVQIHGWSSGPTVWDRFDLGPCIRPSFKSVKSAEGFLPALHAALPDDPCILLGWSLGGMLALETTLTMPNRVAGLILIGTTPKFVSDDPARGWPKRMVKRVKSMLTISRKTTLEQFHTAMFNQDESDAAADFIKTFSNPAAVDFSNSGLRAGLNYLMAFDVSDQLADLSCPVCWIHGGEDTVCPVDCLHVVPESHRRIVLPKTGHAPHWTRPKVVQEIIEDVIHGS